MSEYTEDKEDIFKSILDKFQCERNREAEESFARAFSETDETRMFFINEDKAYTDGKNIVVDPAYYNIYRDEECIRKTEAVLEWPGLVSAAPWNALKMVTRGLTLHECLHLIYTDFPGAEWSDPELKDWKNAQKVVANISNIIEDAYIEAVGASVYDNIAIYLMFNRIAPLFAGKEVESTSEQKFKITEPEEIKDYKFPVYENVLVLEPVKTVLSQEEQKNLDAYLHFMELKKKMQLLIDYFDHMAGFLLFPMFELGEPDAEISDYVERTKQLFLDGSIKSSSEDRYGFCKKIFEIVKPLIPQDEECELSQNLLPPSIGGQGTHGDGRDSIGGKKHKGRVQAVVTRLFSNLDGSRKNNLNTDVHGLIVAIKDFENDEKRADEITSYKGFSVKHSGNSVGASAVHKGVKINENHPKINLNLKKAYQNIYNQYHLNINSYNSRFLQLLKAQVPVRENRFQFGSGIDSKRMGDMKHRFWFRNQKGTEVPDMSVMLLIDGSGSMDGERRNSAMISSVILHEVLKKQGIEHAIVEHRGNLNADDEIDVNILVDFNAKEEEKLNIMQLDAASDNRDGLALYWAEKYINQKTFCDNRLIIVLSDGQPAHSYGKYYGDVACKDTANAAKKIINRGTNIIAVALDDECDDATYEDLKEIYPHLVQCKDLKRLTGQILNIVSRQLM